jgi:hypothetical protein
MGAPLAAGAVQKTLTEVCEVLATWVTTGASGGVSVGITACERSEGEPAPITLLAVTVNVYEMPLVRPDTVQGFTRAQTTAVCDDEPTYGVKVYPVIASPPFDAGAVQATVAEPTPAVALEITGVPGTVAGSTSRETAPT